MYETFNNRSLTESHFAEWVESSGVSPLITELNVRSLDDSCHIDELLNRNTNRRWQHWEHGPGWAVIGIDPETDERTFDGAQFKPDVPVHRYENGQPQFRRDGSPDFQKYFSASATEAVPLFLNTGIPGYWVDILNSNQRLLITEGAKKAGAALTIGEACVSLPGVSTGQRKGRLKKSLQKFCTLGRSLILAFDSDLFHNPNVCKALDRLGRLLLEQGSVVRVLLLPQEAKGIDDFIVAHGAEAFKALVDDALIFEEWRKEFLFDKRKGQILTPTSTSSSTDEPLLVPMADENYILKAQSCLYTATSWISSKGNLYQWVGTHYEQVDPEAEKRRISAWCASTPVMTIDGWAYRYATDTHVQNIWSWVLTSFAVPSSALNPPGLNCLNGTLTLSWQRKQPSWKLEPHSPTMFHTYVGQFEFDPAADPTSCDRLLSCLEPDQREIFLKTLAATLDFKRIRKWCGRDVKAILCRGNGNNGKDALREAAQEVYGNQGVVSTTVSDFQLYDQGKKFYLAKLEHARISWSSENSNVSQLDNLQALKLAITGEPLDIERKNFQDYAVSPSTVFFFNINNAPNLQASLEAIKSRWAVLSFNKTFKTNADPSKGEIEADPRFRYDPDFLRREVVPALLNKMLAALPEVATKAIDYSCTEAALKEIQRETNHLWAFCQDVGLDYQPGERVYPGELCEVLHQWYLDNGYLVVTTNSKGEIKKDWNEPSRRGDRLVKAAKDVCQRFLELFPKAKYGEDTQTTGKKGRACLNGIGFSEATVNQKVKQTVNLEPLLSKDGEASEPNQLTSALVLELFLKLPAAEQIAVKEALFSKGEENDFASPGSPPLSEPVPGSPLLHQLPHFASPVASPTNSPITAKQNSNAGYTGASAFNATNSNNGSGNVNLGNTTKNFPNPNHPTFKIGDRVKAKHSTTYGIPEDQELTIKTIQGEVAAVTYEGCRAVFGINIPLSQLLPLSQGKTSFKEGDRVVAINSTKGAENWQGTVVKLREDGRVDVEWDERSGNRNKRRVYPSKPSDLRLI